MDLHEKLEQINITDYDASDRREIESWRERAIRLTAQLDFKEHPITLELVTMIRSEIQRIESILKEKEDLGELERRALFREKSAHNFYLSLLSKDPTGELKTLERMVDNLK